MACMDARYAKDTPIIRGSLAPMKSSINVMTAADTRDDCMSSTLFSGLSWAREERIIAGVTHPSIIATRCCRERGIVYFSGGSFPFSSKSWFLLSVSAISFIL